MTTSESALDPPEPGETLDRPAIEALYVRLETPMYNVVYRWLWDPEDARDVVQEAFVRLWRARDRVRLDTVEPFVYKIAINLAASRRRRRRLRKWVTFDFASDAAPAQATAAQPDEAIEQDERRAAVRAAIDRLPERQRRVIALCELSGMSYGQVAEVLGIPVGTVASRRHTAIHNLRRSLSGLAQE